MDGLQCISGGREVDTIYTSPIAIITSANLGLISQSPEGGMISEI